MSVDAPTILALDFDGVLCNGLKEYFQTAWRAYCTLWHVPTQTPPPGLAERFYQTRPVVETGWEMPLLIRSLLLGTAEADILLNWATIVQELTARDGVEPAQLAAEVDAIRDRWITADLKSWLAEQEFYPGVIAQLQAWQTTPLQVVIISTKEGRFIQALLSQHHVDFTRLKILGKEVKRPKHQTLRELIADSPSAIVWFVEDRLKTLQLIRAQSDLDRVKLFLADWGYNTPAERSLVANEPLIKLLSLHQFSQDFSTWEN